MELTMSEIREMKETTDKIGRISEKFVNELVKQRYNKECNISFKILTDESEISVGFYYEYTGRFCDYKLENLFYLSIQDLIKHQNDSENWVKEYLKREDEKLKKIKEEKQLEEDKHMYEKALKVVEELKHKFE